MAARVPKHTHVWRIISHTLEARGKKVRVLIACDFCGKTDVIRPHGGKKHDPDFFSNLSGLEHACGAGCPGTLPEDAE